MEFIPELPFDNNSAQNAVWLAIKQSLQNEEGLAYYRYPLYRMDGVMRHEPDIMLVLRKYGIFVIECKGIGWVCKQDSERRHGGRRPRRPPRWHPD